MSEDGFVITPCGAADLPRVAALLEAARLPRDDLDPALAGFLAARDPAGRILGAGGLQPAGDAALLRSLIVDPAWRGRGLGLRLTEALLARAREQGVRQLWLLTTTAADFFMALGFEPADRPTAPAAIRAMAEFRNLCPATAACLRLALPAATD